MVLLDTSTLLWIASGELSRLSAAAVDILNHEPWAVSALTAWEIAIKQASGKLTLSTTAERWWSRAVTHHQLTCLDFTPAIALRAATLPPLHADPFDRGLVATAVQHALVLVTTDARIHAYSERGPLRVVG